MVGANLFQGASVKFVCWIVAAGLILAAAVSVSARPWKDRSGQHQIEAELIGHTADKVWLQQADDLYLVALDDLAPEDQAFAREQVRNLPAPLPGEAPRGMSPTQYAPGRQIATLANPAIDESSGLAGSHRTPGVFWTHNDSGDVARLYAFDRQGRDLGSFLLCDVEAFDWEDMAAWTLDGRHYLLVGDTGNNVRNSAVHILYLVEEPEVDPVRGVLVSEMPVTQVVHYEYEDDYHDCEALAVDPTTKTVLLVSKEKRPECLVYALPWPVGTSDKAYVARRIATLHIPMVTGMDISPDGRHAVVLTYGDAYEYLRADRETWSEAFSRRPSLIVLPSRRQGESICFGPDGRTLYLTSEKRPTPLIEVAPAESR